MAGRGRGRELTLPAWMAKQGEGEEGGLGGGGDGNASSAAPNQFDDVAAEGDRGKGKVRRGFLGTVVFGRNDDGEEVGGGARRSACETGKGPFYPLFFASYLLSAFPRHTYRPPLTVIVVFIRSGHRIETARGVGTGRES